MIELHNLRNARFSPERSLTIGQLDTLLRNLMTMGVSSSATVVLSLYGGPDQEVGIIEFVKDEDSRAEKLVIESR